jgi:hypothetical protein
MSTGGPYIGANGRRATACNALIDYYGAPVVDLDLADATPLSGPVTVTISNLTLKMAVGVDASGKETQRPFAGSLKARLVGGAGGWQRPVTIGPYTMPGGLVMASTVLRDLTMATGTSAATRETVKLAVDKPLGPMFVPGVNVPAARILSMIAGSLWWIDEKGVTQIASARPTTTIRAANNVPDYNGQTRMLTVATEAVAEWMPGAVYTGPTVPERVTVLGTRIHSSSDGVLRVEAMVS